MRTTGLTDACKSLETLFTLIFIKDMTHLIKNFMARINK